VFTYTVLIKHLEMKPPRPWRGIHRIASLAALTFLVLAVLHKLLSVVRPIRRVEVGTIGMPAMDLGEVPVPTSILAGTSSPLPSPSAVRKESEFNHAVASVKDVSLSKSNVLKASPAGMPWNDFVKLPRKPISKRHATPIVKKSNIQICPPDTEVELSKPQQTIDQAQWCSWALDKKGGNVRVGHSWGTLKEKELRDRFDNWNCNLAARGQNPSCTAAWGDEYIKSWIKSPVASISCDNRKTSKVQCFDNYKSDRQCVFENMQINFALQEKVARPGLDTFTKKFDKGFLSLDCDSNPNPEYIKFHYLYSTQLTPKTSQKSSGPAMCDYVINGTVILYSHDDIRNLAHTMNDIMNIWQLLWLHNLASAAAEVTLLSIDSFALGYNFEDRIDSEFFRVYRKTFRSVLSGKRDFGESSTLCLQRVIMQPSPPTLYTWDSWAFDNDCSFRGPSSLFQRFNVHVRNKLGLLRQNQTQTHLSILLLFRKQVKNNWGFERTTRNALVRDCVVTPRSSYLACMHIYVLSTECRSCDPRAEQLPPHKSFVRDP
jgi:hypothetical protein